MPLPLHSNKIKDEKNCFVDELYKSILVKEDLVSGKANNNARNLHKFYLAIYIMNHFSKRSFNSEYFHYLLTSIIESEALFLIGFKNAAMMSLRSAVELSFKFLYFELHPVELCLNNDGKFDLRGNEYREFMYNHPCISKLNFYKKEQIEKVWTELCSYTHYDFKAVDSISVISEIRPVLSDTQAFQKISNTLKKAFRIILINLFLVYPNWLEGVEKSYFDYPFQLLFSSSEVSELMIKLRIV